MEKEVKCNYSEMLQNCKISKETANFMSCVKSLHDLSDQVYDSLMEMFGEQRAEELFNSQYYQKRDKLESVLYRFLRESINENICSLEFDEI